MGSDVYEPEQRTRLKQVLDAVDITVGELWLQYFGMGGSAGEYEVQAYVEGVLSLPVSDRDLLAMAANEMVDGTSSLQAPYADQLGGDAGAGGSPEEDHRSPA